MGTVGQGILVEQTFAVLEVSDVALAKVGRFGFVCRLLFLINVSIFHFFYFSISYCFSGTKTEFVLI